MSIALPRLASSLLFVAVASLIGGACAVDAPAAAEIGTPIDLYLDATELAGPSGPLTAVSVPGDEPVVLDGGVCACTTSACVTDYIEEHLGCGICIAFTCDGDRVGGCVPCGGAPSTTDLPVRVRHADAGIDGPAELAPAPSPRRLIKFGPRL